MSQVERFIAEFIASSPHHHHNLYPTPPTPSSAQFSRETDFGVIKRQLECVVRPLLSLPIPFSIYCCSDGLGKWSIPNPKEFCKSSSCVVIVTRRKDFLPFFVCFWFFLLIPNQIFPPLTTPPSLSFSAQSPFFPFSRSVFSLASSWTVVFLPFRSLGYPKRHTS